MRAFKYFDLSNSGSVDKTRFFRSIEKVGVVVDGDKVYYSCFIFYFLRKEMKYLTSMIWMASKEYSIRNLFQSYSEQTREQQETTLLKKSTPSN